MTAMDNRRKIQINIKVAGEVIPLQVNLDEQENVREAEKTIGRLYDDWRRKFPNKNQTTLLAMMAYQYASYYLAMQKRYDNVMADMKQLDELLHDAIEGTYGAPADNEGGSHIRSTAG